MVNRIGRLLETANFKLSSVASDIVGKTGWLILQAIAAGTTDPERLASLAQGSLQSKKAELVEALRGYTSEHFRWLLRQLLDEMAALDLRLNALEGAYPRPHATPPGSDSPVKYYSGSAGNNRLDADR